MKLWQSTQAGHEIVLMIDLHQEHKKVWINNIPHCETNLAVTGVKYLSELAATLLNTNP